MVAAAQDRRGIEFSKKFVLGVFLPLFFLCGFFVFPFLDLRVATFLCFISLVIVHLNVCFTLTFDSFVRFSRYKLSHHHPVLDKLVSSFMIFACFIGLSPLVLFLSAYSLWVSPAQSSMPEDFGDLSDEVMIPVLQGVILGLFFILVFTRDLTSIFLGG